MPGPVQGLFVDPEAARVHVSLEPVYNAFESLVLLHRPEAMPGLDDWVTRTAATLTPDERERHHLVFIGLYYAVRPDGDWPSFPAYIDHLASLDPSALRDRMLQLYARVRREEGVTRPTMQDVPVPVDLRAILTSPEAYIGFLRERFGPDAVEPDLERQAYTYVVDPPAMQALIVSQLREMWDTYLAPEWARVRPMLEDAVRAFGQLDLTGKSDLEGARLITGQELTEEAWAPMLERAEQVIFVPSAHIGPYLGQLRGEGVLRIVFGARLPEGVSYAAPDLSRAELLVRLNALADNNRLRILQQISERGEQSSQEIIANVQLSQPTVSRHLKQLAATGYLLERRHNSAKYYRLNPERIQATLRALEAFLLGG
ncbi:MAG: ArsR/SmtB family transcription factor [Anaerolineae bacterium]